MSAFSQFVEKLLAEFLGIGKRLFDEILPTLKSQASATIAQVMQIGAQYVIALEADASLSGAEKQTQAVSQIEDALKTAGITAGTSIVNTAIELIVQNLNAQKSAA